MKRGLILFLLCSSLLLTGCGKAETVAEEKAIAVTVQMAKGGEIENTNTDKVQNNFGSKNYERGQKGEWYYFMQLNGHDVLVLDYFHPSYRPPYLMKYYGLMGIYQMALNDIASNK